MKALPAVSGDGTSKTNPDGMATGGGSLGSTSRGAVGRALPPDVDAVGAPQPTRRATESKMQARDSVGRIAPSVLRRHAA
jgi:hypothetical protein